MKVIWLSDLHFVAEGPVVGHDPRVRLSRAVDYINSHHGDADCCVISGDLVDRATGADYQALATELRPLAVPVLPMVGNHDDRSLLRSAMVLPDTAMKDFVQYAVRTNDAVLVCLDTLTPGSAHGTFCDARLSWLARVLSDTRDRPAIVFLHHPPVDLGLPMQDVDRLRDGEALLELLAECPHVRQICAGHVHRPIIGTANDIPFATMRSVLYQAPPPIPAWDWDTFQPAQEAPALGVLTIKGWDVQLHYTQFCDHQTGVIT